MAVIEMSHAIVSDALRGSIRPLRDALSRSGHDFTRDEVLDLVGACAVGGMLIIGLRRGLRGLLENGIEGRKLAFLLKESVDALDESIDTFGRIRTVVDGAALSSTDQAQCTGILEGAEQRAEAAKAEFLALLGFLDRTPSKLDPASFPGTASAPDTKYDTLDSILEGL
jgi:hypothetical protein